MRPPIGWTLHFIAAIATLCAGVSNLSGYVLEGPRWPDGDIAIRLQVGNTPRPLQDGSGTWDNSAADALALWNQQLIFAHFSWSESAGTGVMGDGVNSVFFSNTIYGQGFGANVLAVTVFHYNTSTNQMLEADTIFNTAQRFDSYRGPLQYDPQPLYDFHRVALHEFGHVLGLDHPDENGQSVVALMNSVISDLDHLADDDIAGGSALYGPRFTNQLTLNGNAGDPVYFPLTTNPPASNISVNYLPEGLSYDSSTRVISGTPSWVFDSNSAVVATTANGAISANLRITIGPPAHSFPTFLDFHEVLDRYGSSSQGFYTPPNNMSVTRDEFNRVVVRVGNGSKQIFFQGEGFTPLQAGVYEGALSRVSFSGQTALEINGWSQCVEGGGAFTVREISYGARETILSFWATFQQDCADGLGTHHTGEIRYHVDPDDPLVVPVVSAPASFDVNQGAPISFQISATNGATSYSAVGLPLGVGCSPTGVVSGAPIVAGTFVVRLFATNDLGTGETDITITVHPGPARSHSLLNISTRGRVGTGDDAMIAGFILTGSQRKTVVLRGLGPSLPVVGALLDPVMTLTLAGGYPIGTDNWLDVYYPIYYGGWVSVLGTGLAPSNRLEPAAVYILDPGTYTLGLFGTSNTTGVALVEAYDITPYASSLANISTRAHVGDDDNVLIGGFILGGDQPTKVIVRAIGPSLGNSGVTDPLQDPVLELHDGSGSLISQNDDWRSLQEEAIIATGIPPNDNRESAIVATLPPGNYTAIVRGRDSSTGVGLVEVYNLDLN